MTLRADVEQAVRTLQRVVHDARPGSCSGDEARSLVELFARAEKAAASGIALYTPVVVETGSFAKVGHASAPEWLAAVSGTSTGVAKGRLAAAERVAGDPVLVGAVRDADLSGPQLKLLSDARALDPAAPATLLTMMSQHASHQEVGDQLARLRAAAHSKESARARRSRIHALRHLRWHQVEGGGIRGEFFCDEVNWARVAPTLEAEAKARWKAASGGVREPLEAHRLDAYLEWLSERGPAARSRSARAIVIIDAEALRRGHCQGDELCEIDGIGPVSVEAATELLGAASAQFVIRDGLDIKTVTSATRYASVRTEAALRVRDSACGVPGCGKHHGLEEDHCETDFALGGATTLENLVRLCGPHHAMKTYGGWKLTGPPGNRKWVAPKNPPSAGLIARSARLAKAKSTVRLT